MDENKEEMVNQDVAIEETNLDALSAPEGSYEPIVHSPTLGEDSEIQNDSDIPGDNSLPDNLPNLDNEMEDSSVTETETETEATEATEIEKTQESHQSNTESQDQYWMKPFEEIQKANPEWEIPEGIDENNYLAYLQQILNPNQGNLHPEIQKMQDALDSGVEFNEIINSFQSQNDILNIDDRELMAMNYKEYYKDWDDKKVNEVLDKLDNAGMLEIEAGKLRHSIAQNQERERQEQFYLNEKESQEQIAEINKERSNQIKSSLDIINKTDDIYGLPISQADKSEFSKYFEKLVTPDETGNAPMMEMLQSNETLVKVAMMLWKGDDKIKSALTNAKEIGKKSVLDKLDDKPNLPNKGSSMGNQGKVDFDALAAPERFTGL